MLLVSRRQYNVPVLRAFPLSRLKVIPVTAMVLRPHFNDMEYKLRPGMITLTWTSMNIDTYKGQVGPRQIFNRESCATARKLALFEIPLPFRGNITWNYSAVLTRLGVHSRFGDNYLELELHIRYVQCTIKRVIIGCWVRSKAPSPSDCVISGLASSR